MCWILLPFLQAQACRVVTHPSTLLTENMRYCTVSQLPLCLCAKTVVQGHTISQHDVNKLGEISENTNWQGLFWKTCSAITSPALQGEPP